jgi:Spy/CpxP family protein refolding chaperone
MKRHLGKHVTIAAALALALIATSSAHAQMGGGMMGGFGSGVGMMGSFGSGGGTGSGMPGGYGPGAGSGYGPGAYGAQRAPQADGQWRTSRDFDLGPLDRLDLNKRQLEAINVINDDLRDRRSNLDRRLAAEQRKLRALYDAPVRDRSMIDREFRRMDQLRREKFQSTVDARDRIEAQLNAQQRERLRRIAPDWSPRG